MNVCGECRLYESRAVITRSRDRRPSHKIDCTGIIENKKEGGTSLSKAKERKTTVNPALDDASSDRTHYIALYAFPVKVVFCKWVKIFS
ncbi:hypothetical protein HanIR_Chr01g0030581 [Helianthus annuus]|nr:hypothetical protein HanIR_Chr01g0030581 [Helianthus annuus]